MGNNKDAERLYLNYLDEKERELQKEMWRIRDKRERYLDTKKGIDRYTFLLYEELDMVTIEMPELCVEARLYPLLNMFEYVASSVRVENNGIHVDMDIVTFIFPKSRSCEENRMPIVYILNNSVLRDAETDKETQEKISGLLKTKCIKKILDKIISLGYRIQYVRNRPE